MLTCTFLTSSKPNKITSKNDSFTEDLLLSGLLTFLSKHTVVHSEKPYLFELGIFLNFLLDRKGVATLAV